MPALTNLFEQPAIPIIAGQVSAWLPRLGAGNAFNAFVSDSVADRAWWPCALGLAAVLGHSYTVFLRFKGGKGVASSAGVFLGLAPLATACVIGAFALALAATRMVSAGSLLGAALLPGLVAAFQEWRPAAARAPPIAPRLLIG